MSQCRPATFCSSSRFEISMKAQFFRRQDLSHSLEIFYVNVRPPFVPLQFASSHSSLSQSIQTALAQQPPSCRSNLATTSAVVLFAYLQICKNSSWVSVRATNSSLNGAGVTAFAEPPDVVVFNRKSCFVMAPVAERLYPLMYPGRVSSRLREDAHRKVPLDATATSSDQ